MTLSRCINCIYCTLLGDFFFEGCKVGDGKPWPGEGIVHREDGGVVGLESTVGLHHVQVSSEKRYKMASGSTFPPACDSVQHGDLRKLPVSSTRRSDLVV